MPENYLHDIEAFLFSNRELREKFNKRYQATAALYYMGQPDFESILVRIHENLEYL